MLALKPQIQRAMVVLDALVRGIHPKTGHELPEDSVINEIDVNRALSIAVLALEQMKSRLARKAMLPRSVGQPWTAAEEQELADGFRKGQSIEGLADRHGRTVRGIEARLARLGLTRTDLTGTVDPLVPTGAGEEAR